MRGAVLGCGGYTPASGDGGGKRKPSSRARARSQTPEQGSPAGSHTPAGMPKATALEQLPAPGGPASDMGPGRCSAQVTATISVDELRLLIRGDVEAVVRAELRATGEPGQQRCQPSANGLSHSPRLLAVEGDGLWATWEPERDGDDVMPREPFMPTTPGPGGSGIGGSPQSMVSSAFPQAWMGLERPQAGGYTLLLQEDAQESFEDIAGNAIPDMGSSTKRAVRYLDWLWFLREGPRTGRCANLVQSQGFQAFFACVIAANAVVMVLSVNQDMLNITSAQATGSEWSTLLDHCFLLLYCTELAFKLAVHRLFFFWNDDAVWNWLDFLLVMQSLMDSVLHAGGGRGNTWMRTLRLFRTAKVLRILRVIKFFTKLQLIMTAIVGSLLSLFWCIIVFIILFLMFSLYFVSAVATYLDNHDAVGDRELHDLMKDFGSVQVCMMTLFMSISGGCDWEEYYFKLEPIGTPSMVFVLFIAFSLIALLNVVTGLFVESALKLAEPDVHQKAEEQFQQDKEYARELWKLFMSADKDRSRRLSKDEFQALLENGKLSHLFRYLGIDPAWSKTHLPVLFDKMVEMQQADSQKDHQGLDTMEVDAHTFVERCMALRGSARSTEVMELHDLLLQIQHTQDAILRATEGKGQAAHAARPQGGAR